MAQFDVDLISPPDDDDIVVEVSSESGTLFRMYKTQGADRFQISTYPSSGKIDLDEFVGLIEAAQRRWKNSSLD